MMLYARLFRYFRCPLYLHHVTTTRRACCLSRHASDLSMPYAFLSDAVRQRMMPMPSELIFTPRRELMARPSGESKRCLRDAVDYTRCVVCLRAASR